MHWSEIEDYEEKLRARRLQDHRPHTIYRFDSSDGNFCYIGVTANLGKRIATHCKSGPLSGHLAGHNPTQARRFFEEIDTAAGYKRAEEKESEYIKAAFFDFQFNRDKPQPLNKRLHDIGTDEFESIATKVLIERNKPRIQIEQQNRLWQRRLTNVQRELEDVARHWKQQFNTSSGRLDLTEKKLVRLRTERDKLISQLSETKDAAQSWKQRHGALLGRVARTELKLTDLRIEHEKLTSQLSEAENHQAFRRRARLSKILVLGAAATLALVIFAILNPGVVEQGRDLLSYLLQDVPASIAVFPSPAMSPILTQRPVANVRPSAVTLSPEARPRLTPTRTPQPSPPILTQRPVVNVRPSAVTLSPEARPRLTPTRTPQPSPTPRLLNASFDGVLARTCPHRDCDVLARLTRGSQVTVMDEVQGETYRESTLWYRIAWPADPEEAFVHSSLLGPATPLPPDG